MFAILGEVQFEVTGSPERITSSRRYDYAVHRVVQDRPKLQWLAPDLEVLRFELMLHRSFTDPAVDMAVLLAAAEEHQPLPLIFGNGEFRGTFVISEVSTLSRQLSAEGTPIAIAVRIELLESPLELVSGITAMSAVLPIATTAVSAGAANGFRSAVAAGVSPLIASAAAVGAPTPWLNPDDISPATIVRKSI